MMQLSKLMHMVPGIKQTSGNLDIQIASLTYDSRKITRGSLFVAVQGLVSDGHDFIAQAIDAGAGAVVYDREVVPISNSVTAILVEDSRKALPLFAANFYGHPEDKLTLIGITGTNGKTTSNYFLQHLLSAGGLKTGRVGTTGAALDTLEVDLIHTTPESSDLMEILHTFDKAGAQAATLEVSSHALAQGRTAGLTFKAAVFSNFTQDHLDYHKSLDEYLLAKQLLFKGLDEAALAIINIDDPNAAKMIEGCKARVISYGYQPEADYQIQSCVSSDVGMELIISTPQGLLTFPVNTVGTFNSYNFLSAFVTALELGSNLALTIQAANTLPVVPGRLERMHNNAPFMVFVDYAHTPDAMETVLQTLAEAYPSRQLLSVFGCGGDRDQGKRPIMGEIATRLSSHAIITDDNPRTEESMSIIDAIAAGCITQNNFTIISDRTSAVIQALENAKPGDVVAILGKGHEPYQEIMGVRKPYSDMNVVNQFMEQHGYSA